VAKKKKKAESNKYYALYKDQTTIHRDSVICSGVMFQVFKFFIVFMLQAA
jgi:hypothetical protein